eukprot:9341519-Pyramimonas_sp.AAC.1
MQSDAALCVLLGAAGGDLARAGVPHALAAAAARLGLRGNWGPRGGGAALAAALVTIQVAIRLPSQYEGDN